MAYDTHIPHGLRLAIFFLRLAIGLNLFYLGWSTLFNHAIETTLSGHSVGSLYAWLGTSAPIASIPAAVFAWLFLIAGIFITIGLWTRLVSIIAIILVLAAWLPSVSFANFSPGQFINDEVVMLLALVVLFFGRAGHYLGLDTFARFSMRRKS